MCSSVQSKRHHLGGNYLWMRNIWELKRVILCNGFFIGRSWIYAFWRDFAAAFLQVTLGQITSLLHTIRLGIFSGQFWTVPYIPSLELNSYSFYLTKAATFLVILKYSAYEKNKGLDFRMILSSDSQLCVYEWKLSSSLFWIRDFFPYPILSNYSSK